MHTAECERWSRCNSGVEPEEIDMDPYPTPDAYELVCQAYNRALESTARAIRKLPLEYQRLMADCCYNDECRCWCGFHRGSEFDQ